MLLLSGTLVCVASNTSSSKALTASPVDVDAEVDADAEVDVDVDARDLARAWVATEPSLQIWTLEVVSL